MQNVRDASRGARTARSPDSPHGHQKRPSWRGHHQINGSQGLMDHHDCCFCDGQITKHVKVPKRRARIDSWDSVVGGQLSFGPSGRFFGRKRQVLVLCVMPIPTVPCVTNMACRANQPQRTNRPIISAHEIVSRQRSLFERFRH